MRSDISLILLAFIITYECSESLALAQTRGEDSHASNVVCSALVTVANDLYLVKADGSLSSRFTFDGAPKKSITLAQNGSKVAFMSSEDPNHYVVATTQGQVQQYASGDQDVLMDLSWETESVLRTGTHLSPSAMHFMFWHIPTRLRPKSPFKVAEGTGSTCAFESHFGGVACLQGTDLFINDRFAYSENEFDDVPELATLVLNIGDSAQIPGFPDITAKVVSITSGITLRITLPTGNWIESRIDENDFMNFDLEDTSFGLFPRVVNNNQHAVEIGLRIRPVAAVFQSTLAWRFWNEGVAIMKNGTSGPSLLFLKPTSRSNWVRFGETPLPIGDAVQAMHFVSTHLLYFETSSGFGTIPLDIDISNKEPQIHVGAISSLPTILTVNVTDEPVTVPVVHWSCRESFCE